MMRIIVIGAGILGASTAYRLAKAGADVIIADRGDDGGATAAAAGIICPWISQRRNKAWYKLAREGAAYYPSLIDELAEVGETDTGYDRVGAICLHTDQNKLQKLKERAIERRENAPEMGEIQIISPEEARELYPLLDEEFSAVYISGAGRVNGRSLRDALLKAAKKSGARFISGHAELLKGERAVAGIKTNTEIIHADRVIDCGGAWSASLLAPLGIQFKVSFQKAQIVHMELPDIQTSRWPVVMPPGSQYLLSLSDNSILCGTTHEDTETFDPRPTAGGVQDILSKAFSVAPRLSNATLLEVRTGFRPYTPGYLPVIGHVPGWEGLIAGNGLGASGLTTGPYLGSQLADLALGRELDINLKDYDIENALEYL
ncbi:NAD(P)/FAD-dependent oxidoreductase [Peribacillus sp. SCS-37]|uniref:NAD(P)/FAD-dependent oxidoreductase n=1 Tax=Paraperibacillus esterisolvens TaxID=3115296 RepID=UPI003906739A